MQENGLTIEIQTKTSKGWETELMIFRDPEKINKAKRIIRERLGFETNYLVVNAACSGLPQGDENYEITIDTYWELYSLADEIVNLTPDP